VAIHPGHHHAHARRLLIRTLPAVINLRVDGEDEPRVPTRALVVSAHPDDVDFGAAGTVARLTAAGCTVSYAIVTDGDAGEVPDDVGRDGAAALRNREQRAAAAAVGVDDVRFLGYPDGKLEVSIDLRSTLSRVMREVRPEVVICQSPERRYDRVFASHPDHLAAGEATLQAVYPDARNPHAHPELAAEGLEAWTVLEVWIFAHPKADRFVDITDTIDAKVAALRAHESQTSAMDLPTFLRGWAEATAADGGLDDGRLAEGFLTCRTG
jgi:LmbE family N-acetylglucosaminyl deacetylase